MVIISASYSQFGNMTTYLMQQESYAEVAKPVQQYVSIWLYITPACWFQPFCCSLEPLRTSIHCTHVQISTTPEFSNIYARILHDMQQTYQWYFLKQYVVQW